MRRIPFGAKVAALVLAAGWTALPAHAAPAGAGPARLTAGDLRTDALRTPLGIDDATPTLSWRPHATGHDEAQTAYQIEAASSPARLDDPDLWDSGRVASADPSTSYAGRAPASRQRVWWRVRVWDARGAVSPWTAPSHGGRWAC